MSNLLKPVRCLTQITRNLGEGRGKNEYKYAGEGIKYHGFTYYPRHPDFKDPPYEATKLFRVTRIKPIKGTPYWEREVLKQLGLLGKKSDVAIVKNIPECNARMWKVKHLISIAPITFPDGFPEDTTGTLLKENGQLTVVKKVECEKQIEATERFEKDPKKIDGDTLRRDSRIRWLSGWY